MSSSCNTLLYCVTRFEGKEGYMTFMNSFVEEHIPEMKKFLDQLSVKPLLLFPVTEFIVSAKYVCILSPLISAWVFHNVDCMQV